MRHSLLFILTFALIITGCSQDNEEATTETNTKQKPAVTLKMAEFNDKAWLREELPQEALIYLRMPNPWFLFTGLDNGFKYAQGNEQHVKQLKLIQQGLFDNLISKMESTTKPLAELLAKHMAAPLELAVLNNPQMPTMPGVILATKLDIKQITEFNQILQALVAQQPMLQLSQETDANGLGLLTVASMGMNVLYQFDVNTGRFVITTSMGADKAKLESQLALLKPVQTHPMYDTEKKIDNSGRGLFGFINTKAILPIAQSMVPPEMMASLKMSGMDQLNALAFGYGASNQKTRLKILLDMPVVGFRAYLPTANNQLDISARGQVSSVGVVALPTEIQFQRIESTLLMMNGASPEYSKAKESFKNATGFSVEQMFGMIGPELVYFSDDVSNFFAVRLSNQEQFNQLIKSAADKDWIKYGEYQKDGLTIKHVSSTSLQFEELTQIIKEKSPVLGEIMTNSKSRYYWVEENGYLIYSAIPQPLIERHQRKDMTSVKDWLVNSQKQDLASAFIGFTSSQLNMSRQSYHIYLQILHMLADISGTEIDIFSLPHAGEVGFSEQGSIGFNLDLNKDYLALEFNFEQSLFDVFYGSTYSTVAMIGILSAVALPAYQDYTVKAKVSSVSASLTPIQVRITQQLQAGKAKTETSVPQQLTQSALAGSSNMIESITTVDGTINLRFLPNNEPAILSGATLSLTPSLNQQTGGVDWYCQSNKLSANQMPNICKK